MEELRSTEILDKEIHADARRRAEEILKKSEEDSQAILDSLDEKVAAAKKEKEEFYARKLSDFEGELNAAGPLERLRYEVSETNAAVIKQLNAYLKSLSQEERLEMVLIGLSEKLASVKDKALTAYVYGFDTKKTQAVLAKKLKNKILSVQKIEFGRFIMEENLGLEVLEGIILESEDKLFRCRLTVCQVISELLDKHREDLKAALFEA